jgi:hypothetical protein
MPLADDLASRNRHGVSRVCEWPFIRGDFLLVHGFFIHQHFPAGRVRPEAAQLRESRRASRFQTIPLPRETTVLSET